MKGRSAFALSAAVLTSAACLGLLASLSGGAKIARATCGDAPGEPEALFTFQPPSVGFQVSGPAPLLVTATWVLDIAVVKGSTAALDWGDGSPPTPFSAQDCGDDIAINWTPQSHSHTFTSPGQYLISWNVVTFVASFNIPVTEEARTLSCEAISLLL